MRSGGNSKPPALALRRMSSFDSIVTPRSREGLVSTFDFPTGWEMGRGIFGGLIVGAMVRALDGVAEGRPLRSLTAEIVAPVQPGPATVVVEVLREGNAVTTATARLVQGKDVLAHAVGVLGRKRELQLTTPVMGGLVAPTVGRWQDVEVAPVQAPFAPVFTQHLEFRPTSDLPFSGSSSKEVTGWVRFKEPGARRDAAMLAGLCDAHWPVAQLSQTELRPMSTIAFTFQPFRLDGVDLDSPFFYRAKLQGVDEGYCVENRELWSADGKLLGLNQQTFVIIK